MDYIDEYGVRFSEDRKTLIECPKNIVGNYTVPNDVVEIAEYAFFNCKDLTSVTIPFSVKRIGAFAFSKCIGFKSITILETIKLLVNDVLHTIIDDHSARSFVNCDLNHSRPANSINIPESIIEIEQGTFSGCTGLTEVYIPNSIITIGNNAFENCNKLTSITLPDSVTSIGELAFAGCLNLNDISVFDYKDEVKYYYDFNNPIFPRQGIQNAITTFQFPTSDELPSSITKIGAKAFYKCSNLSVEFIEKITKLYGQHCFE